MMCYDTNCQYFDIWREKCRKPADAMCPVAAEENEDYESDWVDAQLDKIENQRENDVMDWG